MRCRNNFRTGDTILIFKLVLAVLSRFGCFRKKHLLRKRSLSFSHHHRSFIHHKAEVLATRSLKQFLHILTSKSMLMRHSPCSLLHEVITNALLSDGNITADIEQIYNEEHAARLEPLENAVDAELEVLEVVEAHAYACDVEVEKVFAHQVLDDAFSTTQVAEDGMELRKARC